MIPIETIAVFFAASVALAFAPGPDNIFVLTQSALHGRKAGLLVTIGLCTGLLAHTAAVSLGVAAIFQTSALAFNILKIVGAIYLLYLAWQAFRAGAANLDESSENVVERAQTIP
jgi:threonine/homoserine/homoserine lactone efflux protein